MNVTFLSFNIFSLFSVSSFYTINQLSSSKMMMTIFKSRFSHSYNNILYSNTNYHKITLHKNFFYNSLSSVIRFENFEKSIIIENKFFKSTTHFCDPNENREIIISSCNFLNCQSELGGAIFVKQKSCVLLYNSLFVNCTAQNGGACYICSNYLNNAENNHINNSKNKQAKISYCCFSKCKALNEKGQKKNIYGSILFLSSEKIDIFYTSTLDCPDKKEKSNQVKIFQFDVQTSKYSITNINATGCRSKYNGFIELQSSKSGLFKFNSITSLNSGYVISFSNFECDTIEISYCNIIRNILSKSEEVTFPALIKIQHQDIKIFHFVFMKNEYGENGQIVSKIDYDDQKQIIIWVDCLSDSYHQQKSDEFIGVSCDFNRQNVATNDIDHLAAHHCEGTIQPLNFRDDRSTFSEDQKKDEKDLNFAGIKEELSSAAQVVVLSYVPTFVSRKSVTVSLFPFSEKVLTNCGLGSENLECETNVFHNSYSHHLITFMSPTVTLAYTAVNVNNDDDDDDNEENEYSEYQKIGMICAIVEAVLIVVSLIVFIVKKKCSKDDFVINEDSSEEFENMRNGETVEQVNECEVNLVKPDENHNEDDGWL